MHCYAVPMPRLAGAEPSDELGANGPWLLPALKPMACRAPTGQAVSRLMMVFHLALLLKAMAG